MKPYYSLREAWNYLDTKFGNLENVYDAYVLKEDWMQSIDKIEMYNSISEDLLEIEKTFGVSTLRNKLSLLYVKEELLTLPILGYKYSIPTEVETEVKIRLRETKYEINETEKHLDNLLDNIEIDPEILHLKN